MEKYYAVFKVEFDRRRESMVDAKLADFFAGVTCQGDGHYNKPVVTDDKEEARKWLNTHRENEFWYKQDRRSYSSYTTSYYIHEADWRTKSFKLTKAECIKTAAFAMRTYSEHAASDEKILKFFEREGFTGDIAEKMLEAAKSE